MKRGPRVGRHRERGGDKKELGCVMHAHRLLTVNVIIMYCKQVLTKEKRKVPST